jgi:PAS domain S-box-containing protein
MSAVDPRELPKTIDGPAAADQAVVMADTDGVIVHWNDGAERLFGHSAADAIGQTLDLIVPDEFRDRHWAGFHQAMSAGKSKLDRPAAHLPVKCASGAVNVFPARLVFLTDAQERAAGALGVFGQPDGVTQPFSPIEE